MLVCRPITPKQLEPWSQRDDVVGELLAPLGVASFGDMTVQDRELALDRKDEFRLRRIAGDRNLKGLSDLLPLGSLQFEAVRHPGNVEIRRFVESMTEVEHLF